MPHPTRPFSVPYGRPRALADQGTISDYNQQDAMYRIDYDDGVVEWTNLVRDPNIELLQK